MNKLPEAVCNALWIGSPLGPLERACLESFIAVGHPVNLYSYEYLAGVPSGVNLIDAATVLPRAAVFRHRKSGSFSLFSDRFRYQILQAGRGIWIDCDVLCLRPIPDAPFIFGWQADGSVNGAVLKLPSDNAALIDLLAIFDARHWTPPWETFGRRLRYSIRYRIQKNFGIADMSWGMAGPRALTYHLARHGLLDLAQPADVFYPVTWHEMELLTGPHRRAVKSRVTPRTLCIHLWHQVLTRRATGVPPGSFLEAVVDGSWRTLLAANPPN